MQFQPKNYDFVAQAGQQVGQGIQNVKQEMDKATAEKAKKLDEQSFDQKIYPAQIEEAVKLGKEAGLDDASAHIMAVKYFPQRFNQEKPEDAVKRFHENDSAFKQALFAKKSAGTPAVPEQQGATGTPGQLSASRAPTSVQVPQTATPQNTQNATPEQAWQSQHPGQAQNAQSQVGSAMGQEQRTNEQGIGNKVMPSIGQAPQPAASKAPQMTLTTDVTGMSSGATLPSEQPQAQLPPTPGQDAKAPSYQEMYQWAAEQGLLNNENVKAQLGKMENGEIVIPEGMDRSKAMQYLMSQGGSLTPERKEQMAGLATQNDEMRNQRGQEAIQSRDNARKAHDEVEQMRVRLEAARVGQSGKKIDAQTKSAILQKQAEAKRYKSEADLKIAQIQSELTKANKDPSGAISPQEMTARHDELQSLFEAQSTFDQTIKGYDDILKGNTSNALPSAKTSAYPAPSSAPSASKFKVISVQ